MALAFAMAMSAQTLFVGTYNIRQHNSGDDKEGNVWTVRSKVIADQINFEDPDAFGTQECFKSQLDDLTARLDGYAHIVTTARRAASIPPYSTRRSVCNCSATATSGSARHPTNPDSDGTQPAYASVPGASSGRKTPASDSITSIFTWTMWA